MSDKIICKTEKKDMQMFYLQTNKKEYYLFAQKYHKSVKAFVRYGVSINQIHDFKKSTITIRKTIEKIISHIKYIEKEYNMVVLKKTAKKNQKRTLKSYLYQKLKLFNEEYYGII